MEPHGAFSDTDRLQTLADAGRKAQLAGDWDEALAKFEIALELAEVEQVPRARTDILRWTGEVYRERGDLDSAVAWTEQSRAEAAAADLRDRLASALNSLGNISLIRGDLDLATSYYARCRHTAEAAGDEQIVAMADQNLGTIADIQGNATKALMSYRSALHRYRGLGDEVRATRALNNMGMAHVDLEEWEAADRCFAEAAELAHRCGETITGGRVEFNRAELHLRRQRYEDAFGSLERSLDVFSRLGVKPSIANAYKLYGMLYVHTGKPRQAETHFSLALEMARRCENRLLQAEIQLEWSLLNLSEDERERGILHMNRALAIFRDLRAERQVPGVERKLEGLRDLYLPAVQAWGASHAGQHEPDLAGHSFRVADYATGLAEAMGVCGWDLIWLRIGALIHDLGKMAAPQELRRGVAGDLRPGATITSLRAVVGDRMAGMLEFPDEVRAIVRSNREDWNGGGYPDGLAGEAIPLAARVVRVADVFDSLTTPRGLRPAYSSADALEIMGREAKPLFDPAIWETFREFIEAARPVQEVVPRRCDPVRA